MRVQVECSLFGVVCGLLVFFFLFPFVGFSQQLQIQRNSPQPFSVL